MSKTVYAFDRERNYIGTVELDRSDLDPVELQAGREVYLLPGNCWEASPLPIPEGKQAFAAVTGEWMYLDLPEPEPGPEPEEPEGPGEPETPTYPDPPPELDFAARLNALRDAVQAHMDQTARAYGYDDIKTAVTYAEEPAVARFQFEGQRMRAWRSLVWAACYQILEDVQALRIEEPTLSALLPMLPVLDMIDPNAEEQAGPPAPVTPPPEEPAA
jgi:hypothetical protein